LHFAPDGRTFVYSDGGTLHFVDVAAAKELRPPHFTGVTEFTFAAGGRWLVTASKDRLVHVWELASGLELYRLAPPDCGVYKLVVAPAGRALLTLNEDATILVWDLAPPGWEERQGRAEDFDRLWADLAASDGPAAYRAVWALAADPGRSVAGLRQRLPGSVREVAAHGKRLRSLIADLDSDSFDRREAASKELATFGAEAEPALRRALAGEPSVEVRKRLEELLSKVGGLPAGETLRLLRTVEVLERIGSPEARQTLETVAKGAPDGWLAQEAKASLERLARRPAAP
jgi:hypothetical protein